MNLAFFGGRWCSGGQLSFTPSCRPPASLICLIQGVLSKPGHRATPPLDLRVPDVTLGAGVKSSTQAERACEAFWGRHAALIAAALTLLQRLLKKDLEKENSSSVCVKQWKKWPLRQMSKWVADAQILPLGPCGPLQLPSAASFHWTQPRSPSPWISTVALLYVCGGVFFFLRKTGYFLSFRPQFHFGFVFFSGFSNGWSKHKNSPLSMCEFYFSVCVCVCVACAQPYKAQWHTRETIMDWWKRVLVLFVFVTFIPRLEHN